MAEGAERKEQVAAWTADKKQVSAYAMNLQQIGNGSLSLHLGGHVLSVTRLKIYG
uniref:Uncharacterized protein n=1 Tax=Nelumbo nucifera TaxID=4432 RepID=A0A822ZPH4_NELNU|nr:TPA_asm: hypothetical protein HUJ06_003625 [Nelumbo nucifera]